MSTTPSGDRSRILQANRRAYDAMVDRDSPLCRVATDEELADPLGTVDAAGWLGGSIAGQRVLCLAAGGGRQSSLYTAAGADVTVVDLSPAMLELDRQVARQRDLRIRVFETSMDDLSGLTNGEFDLVVHPVSTCYLPAVDGVFAEVARVLRPGGLYISQHKTPTSLQGSIQRGGNGKYSIEHSYYRSAPIPAPELSVSVARRLRESGAIEFLHRWEEIVGGICRAGFVIEDLIEPMHAKTDAPANSFADRASYIAPYVRIKARRHAQGAAVAASQTKPSLWIPD